jgi:hypothetical protein
MALHLERSAIFSLGFEFLFLGFTWDEKIIKQTGGKGFEGGIVSFHLGEGFCLFYVCFLLVVVKTMRTCLHVRFVSFDNESRTMC